MATKPKARGRSAHPGVVLKHRIRSNGTELWNARWTDPITGVTTDTSLTGLGLTNGPGRRAWAIAKSRQIDADRQAMASGRVARDGPTEIAKVVEDYVARGRMRLRPGTVESYEESLAMFTAWAKGEGLREMRALTPPLLRRFRDVLIASRRTRARSGEARGARGPVEGPRAGATINRHFSQVKAFLNEARRHGRAPALDGESIRVNLAAVRADLDRPEFMRPGELHKLLEAAIRHDADCYVQTRDEKAAGTAGETSRHPPIAPLVLAALLTGCRVNELLTLPWAAVHLDGRGEIIVTADIAKTHRARAVDLGVAPVLVRLFERLRLTSGGSPFVFGRAAPLPRGIVEAARKRLVKHYGAPPFAWQVLRSTCATFSMNAPALFGTAGAFQSARRLGHSVVIAERHYAGLLPDVSHDARTIEAAMGLEDLADKIAGDGRLRAREVV